MKHVLPFKQKQIEQRQFEAEAEKRGTRQAPPRARHKPAVLRPRARPIHARSSPMPRAYRQERLGKVASEQLARDGALISRHPLLIQKTLADKLSDKVAGDHRACTHRRWLHRPGTGREVAHRCGDSCSPRQRAGAMTWPR
jgi:hypothetical protein